MEGFNNTERSPYLNWLYVSSFEIRGKKHKNKQYLLTFLFTVSRFTNQWNALLYEWTHLDY